MVLPFGRSPRQKAAQVSESDAVRAQQREAARLTLLQCRGNPNVGTHDRLDPARQSAAVEFHEREQIALVRQSDSGHIAIEHAVHERRHR